MSQRKEVWERIEAERVIAIARGDGTNDLVTLVSDLGEVGIRVFEMTMTTPRALENVEALRKACPETVIGVGSVLHAKMARDAIDAGAQFLVSPILDVMMLEVASQADIVMIPGTFTPTEAQCAWEAGADAIKVFPASVLGPEYISAVLAPLPHLRLVPTGGIDLNNAGIFLTAGASVVCIGAALIDRESLRTGDYKGVLERAEVLVSQMHPYREGHRQTGTRRGKR